MNFALNTKYSRAMFLLSGLGFSALIFFKLPNHERQIIGIWKESAWKYELIDDKTLIDNDLKKIVRHEAEYWEFQPKGRLLMYKSGTPIKEAAWKIKGRGHILKITHSNGDEELYDIKVLNKKELVVNFDIGMETRGIAKLTFEKTKQTQGT